MSLQKIKNYCIFLLAITGYRLALLLPRAFGLWLFGAVGSIAFLFPNTEKTRTIEHLRLIYGSEWAEKKIRATARRVYRSLGKNMFDAVKLSRAPDAVFHRIVRHDDLAAFRQEFGKGRGVFVITAHVGCFEMLLQFFARHGFRSFAVGKKSFDPGIDGIIRSIRSGKDIEYFDRSENPRRILRCLQEGMAFGVLIDQDTDIEGVFAPFLGRIAFTPSGPLRMAMRFKIPAVVATTARQPDNTHHVYLSGPLVLADTGDFEADLVANVQAANDLICKTIRAFPDQWVWMHRRWKTQPEKKQ